MATMKNTFICNDRGFTLVELMVAMVMAIFLILGTMTISEMATRSYESQDRITTAQQSVRGAMDMMVRQIRLAGLDPLAETNGTLANAAITTAAPTNLVFGADLDASGAIDATNERIQYTIAGDQLQLQRWQAGAPGWTDPVTVIDGVTFLRFDYFDEEGGAASSADEIALVVVNMTVTATDSDGGSYNRNLSTRINCRNLRM